jgi:hypothetical protein
MNATQIEHLFTDADMGFAISDARNWEHTNDREYTANLFGALDKRLTPTSESGLWGLLLEDINDPSQALDDLIPWWIAVYDAVYAARANEDQDAEDEIIEAVYEGRGDAAPAIAARLRTKQAQS